ncbi:hypothetical protein QBC46DRAFT_340621 [Diplogelasinospora grovesii]|uniref:Uncharacterized protein n=1 Tax=Diplogelasinospora grovesii TaxID=303347 RepID=A0AAN6S5J9_9PEZI|nr:hypothetical protein QBC46DRAFT_340621 [Diplogelasinospora grovesii]
MVSKYQSAIKTPTTAAAAKAPTKPGFSSDPKVRPTANPAATARHPPIWASKFAQAKRVVWLSPAEEAIPAENRATDS